MGYYVFGGNPDCGACSAQAGEYFILPGRPHENCVCEIEYTPAGCAFDVTGGSGTPVGSGPEGYEFDTIVIVECDDGAILEEPVSIYVDKAVANSEEIFEAIDDAVQAAAAALCEQCPPPAIC